MPESAAHPKSPRRPHAWDKRVSAAYLRILGHTQDDAAKAVGRAARTIREWEAHPSWPDAEAEARRLWLTDTADAARRTLLESVRDGDAQSARWVLERTDPALEPPTSRVEHKGNVVLTIEALLEQAESTDGNGD